MFAIEEPVSALAVSPITSEDEVSAAPSLPCFYFTLDFHSRPPTAHFAVTRAAGDNRHGERSHLHAATANARRVVEPTQTEACSGDGRWSLASGRRAGHVAQRADRVDSRTHAAVN
jgi:hypothetical protein